MKAWLLFILGSIAYFIIRYLDRTDKTTDLDIKFWFKHNGLQFVLALILNIAAMVIFMDSDMDITEWLKSFLPTGVIVPIKLLVGFGCGLGLGKGVYELFKEKFKKEKEKILSK